MRKNPGGKTVIVLEKDQELERLVGRIIAFQEDEPQEILGLHVNEGEKSVVIHAYLPRAEKVWVKAPGRNGRVPMTRLHRAGFFQARVAGEEKAFPYKIGFRDETGYEREMEDPYAFKPQISDEDLHLYAEGRHFKAYEKFGARPMTVEGVSGVHFAVWAPNAKAVSVVGNFNHWYPGHHPMIRVHFSGIWALFVPGLKEGEVYKYAIKTAGGHVIQKADPYAFRAELRPHTASMVADLGKFRWSDKKWMESRAKWNYLERPISIYEAHLGSWKRDQKKHWGYLSYRDLAHGIAEHVKAMGFTHVELLPVMEHPLDMSWGYQVINYFAATSRFGPPEDFMYFVDHLHRMGIGVILDWVPAHFPRDSHGLSGFDGREIYAYEGWKKGEHREWGTLVFDYGRSEVRNFLMASALFWLDKHHVDGLRVDAVASMLYLDYSRKPGEWEPNQYGGNENLEAIDFIKRFNEIVHSHHPGVLTIAEESTAFGGVSRPTYAAGLGFSLKWNMGWMHDTLEYFSKDPIHRKWHQGTLTFSLLYAFTENFVLPISHDEVVYGKRSLLSKMPGDEWRQLANYRLFLAYMFTHPGKKILFMGQEFGQASEWNFDRSIDWHVLHYDRHQWARLLVKDLNHLYCSTPALHEKDFGPEGFEWIDFSDAESSVMSYIRWSRTRDQFCVIVLNLTPVPRLGYRIGVPKDGFYREILNTDAAAYGGSGIGNFGGMTAQNVSWHGRPYSLGLNLPPLAGLVFRHEGSLSAEPSSGEDHTLPA